MIEFSQSEIAAYYAARVPGVKQTRTTIWRGPCPIHNGKNPNFAVCADTGQAFCHSGCGKGFDILGVEMELTGRPFPDCKKTVFEFLGRPLPKWNELDIQATYDYTNEKGELLYQVVRKFGAEGKKFSQRRPKGDGNWIDNITGVTPVPFQLSKLIPVELCAVVEGEKDAINLTRAGIAATCNNGGAEHFRVDLVPWFAGKRVMILPDNDSKGRSHAMKVAKLLKGTAASVRIVQLPGLAEKGDVSDFLQKGGTAEEILQLHAAAIEWTPEWKFFDENDKYVRTMPQCIEECGGLDKFWDLVSQQGIPTPWMRLTRILAGGLRNGEVYVVGGNQGSGKTSLMLQFVMKALREQQGVLLFSMEMSHRDVFQRIASIAARVNLQDYRECQRARTETEKYRGMRVALNEALAEYHDAPLLVSTKSSVTTDFLLKETMRLKGRQRIDLVVIDHMQLMGSTGSARGDYEKFTAISRATKQVAMELRVPVLLVSQTSRNNASEKRKELEVSDLRGSGAIEEDAAGVILLYPDQKDMERTLLDDTFSRGPVKTWLKMGKNRYGEQGKYMPMMHFKTCTRFDELEGRS